MSDTHNNDPFDDIEAEIDDDTEANAEAGLDNGPHDNGLGPIDQLIAERDEWKDRALRVAAEMENLKRRSETQQNDARAFAIQRFAKDLLPVADSLQRALQAAPKDSEGPAAALVMGLELVEKSLQGAFASNNLKQVAPGPGEAFDPHLHQAMMEQPSETVPGGKVLQTMQAGYELFGRTVRPAMVVVAAKGSGPKAAAGYGDAPGSNGAAYDTKA